MWLLDSDIHRWCTGRERSDKAGRGGLAALSMLSNTTNSEMYTPCLLMTERPGTVINLNNGFQLSAELISFSLSSINRDLDFA